jgi:hypothetical protein
VDADGAVARSTPGRRRALIVAGVVVLVGYGWWATGLRPFTWSSLAAILLPGVAMVATSPKLRTSGPSVASWYATQRQQFNARASEHWIWVSVVGAIVVWQLVNFFASPRADHPTLSSMLGTVEDHPVRLVLFVFWLALGWFLTRR